MTADHAKRLVARLRQKACARTLPESDIDLLRWQVQAHENVSFALAAASGLVLLLRSGWSWWDLGFLGAAAFILYSCWNMIRLRQAIRLFEGQGAKNPPEI